MAKQEINDGYEKYEKIEVSEASANKRAQRARIATNKILKLLAKGYMQTEIVDMLQHDEMDLGIPYSKTQALKMVNHAVKIIKENYVKEQPALCEKIVQCYWDTYKDARENNDRQAAVKALNEVTKITGIHTPKVDVNHTGAIVIEFGTQNNDEENEEYGTS